MVEQHKSLENHYKLLSLTGQETDFYDRADGISSRFFLEVGRTRAEFPIGLIRFEYRFITRKKFFFLWLYKISK